jgi:hypothetical protein
MFCQVPSMFCLWTNVSPHTPLHLHGSCFLYNTFFVDGIKYCRRKKNFFLENFFCKQTVIIKSMFEVHGGYIDCHNHCYYCPLSM